MFAADVESFGLGEPFTPVVVETIDGGDPHVPAFKITTTKLDALIVGRPDVELKC